MAILSNGKFYGFLCSAKETGQKLANGAKEYVEDFVSGFAGHGWKIWEYVKGKWMLEIDSIRVRGQFTVFELLVSKIRAIIGAQAITQGCGRIKTAKLSDDGTAYLITLEDKAMSFVEHDFIRCQEFDGGQKMYHVEIESVADGVIRVPISEFERDGEGKISNSPVPGDDIVQFGNSSHDEKYAGRHSAIYMHADEGAPAAIDVMDGIYSKDWSNCLRVRMGGNIPDSGNLKGLYCVNGMIKGTDDTNHVTYCLYPDGTAELGDGCALFKPDRSGHIAGGAISWEWDESKKEYVCTMRGTVLTWDNLDDEAKENLKGEPGKDGSDGVTGNNGVSLVYKGEFASHPANPQSGWYYRNTTDKKSYVYQDNAWYVMTVDGSDGKNGLDGANGQDGNDGLSVVWKGDLTIPPMNPQKNWAYRDTDNGRVYIYNGTAWELMVADGHDGTDGTDGADGMKVYITYHDSETEPELPTGDGTIGGWHTNATSSVVWMSQKVATDAVSGEWGGPIRIKGKPGEDANMLPWLDRWNGYATELGEEYIVTPKMFSGTSRTDENEKKWLTGIAQGKECITDKNGMKRTGIFALVDNEVKFALDPNSGEYLFKGRIEANEGKFTGEVNATSGNIGELKIKGNKLSSSNLSSGIEIGSGSEGESGSGRFLRLGGNPYSSLVGIRLDRQYPLSDGHIGMNIDSFGTNNICLAILANAGSKFAISSAGPHRFYQRSGEIWDAPGVLWCGEIYTVKGAQESSLEKQWGNGITVNYNGRNDASEYIFSYDGMAEDIYISAIAHIQNSNDGYQCAIPGYIVGDGEFRIIWWNSSSGKMTPKYFQVTVFGRNRFKAY